MVRPPVAGLVRLVGPDSDPDAQARTADAARAFNAIADDTLTAEKVVRLKDVAATLDLIPA